MIKMIFGGICKGCPYADLRISTCKTEDTCNWYVTCDNNRICLRTYEKGKESAKAFDCQSEGDDGK